MLYTRQAHISGLIRYFKTRLNALKFCFLPVNSTLSKGLSAVYNQGSDQFFIKNSMNSSKYKMIARLITMLESYQEPSCAYKLSYGM